MIVTHKKKKVKKDHTEIQGKRMGERSFMMFVLLRDGSLLIGTRSTDCFMEYLISSTSLVLNVFPICAIINYCTCSLSPFLFQSDVLYPQ
jgi:hypothetical protein